MTRNTAEVRRIRRGAQKRSRGGHKQAGTHTRSGGGEAYEGATVRAVQTPSRTARVGEREKKGRASEPREEKEKEAYH